MENAQYYSENKISVKERIDKIIFSMDYRDPLRRYEKCTKQTHDITSALLDDEDALHFTGGVTITSPYEHQEDTFLLHAYKANIVRGPSFDTDSSCNVM